MFTNRHPKSSLKKSRKSASFHPTRLQCEPLENRLMLSTVEIFAAGETGAEAFNVLVDGNVVQTFENVGGDFETRDFQKFVVTTEQPISANQVSIQFINDDFDPETGADNNLFIDGIRVDGLSFQTEAPSTFSTGVIDAGEQTGPGFLETEVLNIDGTVSFLARPTGVESLTTGTRIRIDATGQTAQENLQLEIDGEAVANFEFFEAGEEQILLFTTEQIVDPSQLTIRFTNDLFDEATGFDRNVFVKAFQVIDLETGDRDIFSTNDNRVFSDASFKEIDGIQSGFGRGGALVTNSFLDVRQNSTRIRVDAQGTSGEEVFEIVANGNVIGTFQATTEEQIYLVETPEFTDLADVQIRFVNDFVDAESGIDRNLRVARFQSIDLASGERLISRPTDGNVFSTGTFLESDGIVPGFGRGDTLATNGFFQFQPESAEA